jgi:hypothetical protein
VHCAAPKLHPPELKPVGRAAVQVSRCAAEAVALPGGASRRTGTTATTAMSTSRTTRYVPLHSVGAAMWVLRFVAASFVWLGLGATIRAHHSCLNTCALSYEPSGNEKVRGCQPRGQATEAQPDAEQAETPNGRLTQRADAECNACGGRGGDDATQPSVRRQHNTGYKHKANVRAYYQQFEQNLSHNVAERNMKCAQPPLPCDRRFTISPRPNLRGERSRPLQPGRCRLTEAGTRRTTVPQLPTGGDTHRCQTHRPEVPVGACVTLHRSE